MSDQDAIGTEQSLPYERKANSPADAMERLSAALDSEHPSEQLEADEPAARKAPKAQEAEPEDETPEEDPDDESEDESDEDDEAEGDEDEEPAADPLHEITVDGQTQKITLKEALAGYQRQADYTRGKVALAREKELAQAEQTQARAVREQYAQRLEAFALALEKQKPKEPDWDQLRKENPTEYAVLRADQARWKEEQREILAEQSRVFEERKADWEAQQEANLKAEQDQLLEKLPEWKDKAKADAEKAKLRDYVIASGWTQDDLANVTDHRLMLALRKAMLWDESQTNGAAKIREKVRPTKLVKPGTPDRAPSRGKQKVEVKRARELARRTGSIEDVARLLDLTTGD